MHDAIEYVNERLFWPLDEEERSDLCMEAASLFAYSPEEYVMIWNALEEAFL